MNAHESAIARLQAIVGTPKEASFMPIPGAQQPDPNQQAAMAQQAQMQPAPPQQADPNQQAAMAQQAQMQQPDPAQAIMQQIEPAIQQIVQALDQVTQAMQVLKQENVQQWQELQKIKEEQMHQAIKLEHLMQAWTSAQDIPAGLQGLQMGQGLPMAGMQ